MGISERNTLNPLLRNVVDTSFDYSKLKTDLTNSEPKSYELGEDG